MTAHTCKVLQPDVCYRCALNVDEVKEYEESMSRFERLWEQNEDFFYQPALDAATPDSQLDKLEEELNELREDIGEIEEAADVLVCLIGFCIKSGWDAQDLLEALEKKTTKNLNRRWQLMPNGTYQHIKGS